MGVKAAAETAAGSVLGGRYTLGQRIAAGGMAEIFVARQSARAGFEKDVVIKLLQARFRSDPRVVEMFLEEARIGAALNHPNIVHVYDVGDLDGTPYIAMEYIHGEELSELCKRGLEAGDFLPFAHAVDLVRQAAEGMGYFHAKRDERGEPLAIVHRDISPSNLLVTRDGGLKIIDFGIATSRRHGGGAAGLLPGKFNYMAPEQARGEPVDHRADVYALGIVLYEVTVGRRLFKGKPEEVKDRVAKGTVKPPTFVRRDFPQRLEAIVMRALEKHADDRYQNAYELASDLQEFLHEAHLKSGPFRIAQYLDELEARAGRERRPELSLAGEAWVDDEGEDALDFGRQFRDVSDDAPPAPPSRARTPSTPPRASSDVPTSPAPLGAAPGAPPAAVPRRAADPGSGATEMVFSKPPPTSPANTAAATAAPPPATQRVPSAPPGGLPAPPPSVSATGRLVAPIIGQAVVERERSKSPLGWMLLGAALATVVVLLLTKLVG